MQEYRDALRAEHRRAKAEQKRANPITGKERKGVMISYAKYS